MLKYKYSQNFSLLRISFKDLHGSLESCPAENVLAEDPEGLKVTLMDHQKHALAWMHWREKQKPRGGILADDMGLGKTLTMISLVLSCKNRDEENEEDEKSDSATDEDDENNKRPVWSTKGRRDCRFLLFSENLNKNVLILNTNFRLYRRHFGCLSGEFTATMGN